MLSGMRRASGNWLGRIVIVVLFGLLILSFAVWGIADTVRTGAATTVATVGSTRVTAEAFRKAYADEIQRLIQRARRAVTNDEARALGVDRAVVDRLVNEAVLDEEARRLGLALTPEAAARQLLEEPAFRGAGGRFDRAAFDAALRNAGLTEAGLINEQRRAGLRRQLVEGTAGGVAAPRALVEALHRYRAEERRLEVIALPASAAGEAPEPDEAALRAAFDSARALYRAPELRRLVVLALTPALAAGEVPVTDEDLRRAYDAAVAAGRLGAPERRALDQVVFPDAEAARAASERLKAGLTFDALMAERGVTPADADLGLTARADLADAAVAAAGFALAPGAVSEPVAGAFGPVILRLREVQPGTVPSFEEAREGLVPEARAAKQSGDPAARARLDALRDRIEEARAAGRPLTEAAAAAGLTTREVEVDATGRDAAGRPVDLPEAAELLRAAFAADVGVETEALRGRDGSLAWFEVARVEPARDRAFEEVREQVTARLREDGRARRLAAAAGELVKRLDAGEDAAAVAASANAGLRVVERATRAGDPSLGQAAVAAAFGTAPGRATQAAAPDGGRLVVRVLAATTPPLDPADVAAGGLKRQLDESFAEDVAGAYVGALRAARGAKVDQRAVAAVIGGANGP